MNGNQLFFTGSCASEDTESIILWEFQKGAGKIKKLEALSGFYRPSYLAIGGDNENLYAVSERVDGGEVLAFTLDSQARPRFLNKLATAGKSPCHLLADRAKNLLITSNYMSGSLSVFSLAESGALQKLSGVYEHQPSENVAEKLKAHAHCALLDKRTDRLLAADLGLETIFAYHVDYQDSTLTVLEHGSVLLPQGSGPRHLLQSPRWDSLFYVICEISSQIYVIKTGCNPQILQCVSTLPAQCDVQSFASAIRISPDGRFLYASNRGFDSIAVFQIASGGLLALVDICKVSGVFPRDFYIFESFAIVAYQTSDMLEIFSVDKETGLLAETGIKDGADFPVCVCPLF